MSATLAAFSLITLSIFVILIPIVYIVTIAIRQGLELSNDTHGEEKRANTLNRTGTETTAFGMIPSVKETVSTGHTAARTMGTEPDLYEIPRETHPSELAEEFGISPQALSKRFRRAHRTLAENEVIVTPPENE